MLQVQNTKCITQKLGQIRLIWQQKDAGKNSKNTKTSSVGEETNNHKKKET
jgi:hypothetical protein